MKITLRMSDERGLRSIFKGAVAEAFVEQQTNLREPAPWARHGTPRCAARWPILREPSSIARPS